jgi:MFS family permease
VNFNGFFWHILQTDLQVHWNASGISIMHMCFYAGIFACTFVAQSWAQRFGPKAVISAGILANIFCTWSVPLAVFWVPHFASVAALRFMMGFSQGFFIPCASMLIAKWFPEAEKSLAMA